MKTDSVVKPSQYPRAILIKALNRIKWTRSNSNKSCERGMEQTGISDNRSCIHLPQFNSSRRGEILTGSLSAKHLYGFVSNPHWSRIASLATKTTKATGFTVMVTVCKTFTCRHDYVLKHICMLSTKNKIPNIALQFVVNTLQNFTIMHITL